MANYDAMVAEVALLAGNLQTSHPQYTNIGTYVNRAANKLIRMAPQMFPEMTKDYDAGPTVAGTNSIAYPPGCIVVIDVHSAHQSAAPDWNITKAYPLNYVRPAHFDLLTKDSTVTGYPSLYTRVVNSIKIWPTPTAAYIDRLHLFGIAEETAITTGQTFVLSLDWHDAVIKLAGSILFERLGQYDESQKMLLSVKQEVKDALSQRSAEAMSHDSQLRADGPTRTTVYG
jgi:hypothetical protein